MHSHRLKVTVPDTHQIVLRLPDDFPSGGAEVTVVSGAAKAPTPSDDFAWLEEGAAALPRAPVISIDAVDRAELHR